MNQRKGFWTKERLPWLEPLAAIIDLLRSLITGSPSSGCSIAAGLVVVILALAIIVPIYFLIRWIL